MTRVAEKWKNRLGFTLAELLIVVALISVLSAVTVPIIATYQKDMKISELDDGARSIFMAAQSRLTAMHSASNLLSTDKGKEAFQLNVTGAGAVQIMWVTNASGMCETNASGVLNASDVILPAGTIAPVLEQGYYVVEYNAVSATVYGVFYAERSFDYETVRQYRDRSARKSQPQLIGYYGGGANGTSGGAGGVSAEEGDVVVRPETAELPAPKVTITNGEELVLTIYVPDTGVKNEANLRLDVTVNGTDKNGNPKSYQIIKAASAHNKGAYKVYLDTFKDTYNDGLVSPQSKNWMVGRQFKDWVKASGISPGCNITITVELYGGGLDGVHLPGYVSKTVETEEVNSLFASRSGSAVEVAYGRHLQNLDLDNWGTVEGVKWGTTDVVQTAEINFGTGSAWASTYGTRPFLSILNGRLCSYNGQEYQIRNLNATVNTRGGGGRNYLSGLFASFNVDKYYDARLSNIVLVDATVQGTTSSNGVGSLVGQAYKTTISGCKSYMETAIASQKISTEKNVAGGLIGVATDCVVENSFAATSVYAPNVVGGLIGKTDGNVTIKNSYAACHNTCYTAGWALGGLVGDIASGNLTIDKSYSAGSLQCKNVDSYYSVGGLVGRKEKAESIITITNSYAAAEIGGKIAEKSTYRKTDFFIYGVSPSGGENCPYLAQDGVVYTTNKGKAYYDIASLNTELSGMGYVASSATGFKYNLCDVFLSETYPYYTLDGLKHYGDWAWNYRGDVGTFYWERHDGKIEVCSAGWCDKGEYFVNTDLLCRDPGCHALITEYGYGYYYRADVIADGNEAKFNRAEYGFVEDAVVSEEVTKTVNKEVYGKDVAEGKGYVFHAYTVESMQAVKRSRGWLHWTEKKNSSNVVSTDTEIWWTLKPEFAAAPGARDKFLINALLNPDFAGALKITSMKRDGKYIDNLVKESDSCNDTTNYIGYRTSQTDKPYEVRTVQHLQNLNNNDGTTWYYLSNRWTGDQRLYLYLVPSHNVTAAAGKTFTPVGNTNNWFNGYFYGKYTSYSTKEEMSGYQIEGLKIESDARYVGLFGVAGGGEIKDITLSNCTVTSTYKGSESSGVGVLAGAMLKKTVKVSGGNSIRFCSLLNSSINCYDGTDAGCLVGQKQKGITIAGNFLSENTINGGSSTTIFVGKEVD